MTWLSFGLLLLYVGALALGIIGADIIRERIGERRARRRVNREIAAMEAQFRA